MICWVCALIVQSFLQAAHHILPAGIEVAKVQNHTLVLLYVAEALGGVMDR